MPFFSGGNPFGSHFGKVFATRAREADEFYSSITPTTLSQDKANVMRQALAGMLWSKQYLPCTCTTWRRGEEGRATSNF